MKKWIVALVALVSLGAFALTACGENKWVKKAADIEKKACSCKDTKCVLEVSKMVKDYQKEAGDKKVVKSDGEKIKEHMDKAAKCIQEFMSKKAGGKAGDDKKKGDKKK